MEERTLQTEFNSNLATLIRIDTTLKMAAQASIDDDFISWFKALAILRREAIVKMKGKKEHKDLRKKCNEEFEKLEKELKFLSNTSAEKSFLTTDIDNKLDDFEILLRDFMDLKGMLMRDEADEATRALK